MKPSVVVVGSLNQDIVVQVEELPREGETLMGIGMSESPGGKGANQGVAIGKLQACVSMIGKVGSDPHAASLMKSLQQAGVDTRYIMTSNRPTGLAFVTVDRAGSNHIVVIPGANHELTPEDIDSQRQAIEKCEIVVLQLEIPLKTVEYTLRLAKELGKTTVLNPAPAQMLCDEILRFVDFLIPNEHELQSMSGMTITDASTLQAAARVYLSKGVRALIVTLGGKGCCYIDHERVQTYPARKVKAQDTTAAGDSFIGGFVAGYLKYHDVDLAIELAQKAAAITVTRHGAQSSLPTWEEVAAFDLS
ncbi:ribokinase [Paenibacillus naphthalenovorans]|uniref:Ribokinase n=1 Tax=Paenibacillus naphthalenovorans TaxID=162209 RepID=A0A0U2WCK4_9BACL|nr:ribokinase [Paenibacillus naphthalenovorans]ALS25205.1 ribokinase [Paenibacillus naphthalenovorans]